jgi:hypothetical protein
VGAPEFEMAEQISVSSKRELGSIPIEYQVGTRKDSTNRYFSFEDFNIITMY